MAESGGAKEPLQPGLLVAEPFSWKSLITGHPLLRIRTTGTRSSVLCLPEGYSVTVGYSFRDIVNVATVDTFSMLHYWLGISKCIHFSAYPFSCLVFLFVYLNSSSSTNIFLSVAAQFRSVSRNFRKGGCLPSPPFTSPPLLFPPFPFCPLLFPSLPLRSGAP